MLNGKSLSLWVCSCDGKEGVAWSNDLNQPKGVSFKSTSTMVMCFLMEFTLSGLHFLHLIERNILRRKFEHGCDKLVLAIYDWAHETH